MLATFWRKTSSDLVIHDHLPQSASLAKQPKGPCLWEDGDSYACSKCNRANQPEAEANTGVGDGKQMGNMNVFYSPRQSNCVRRLRTLEEKETRTTEEKVFGVDHPINKTTQLPISRKSPKHNSRCRFYFFHHEVRPLKKLLKARAYGKMAKIMPAQSAKIQVKLGGQLWKADLEIMNVFHPLRSGI